MLSCHGKVFFFSLISMHRRLLQLFLVLTFTAMSGTAQQATKLDVFCGADLQYADVNYTRLFNVLLNLTPGVKYHLGNDWMVAAQGLIPIVNDGYDSRYDMLRLNAANISKEVHFNHARQHLKFTAGLFTTGRYGGDVRWMYPVNDWLMLQARVGLTSYWFMGFDFDDMHETEFDTKFRTTATVGGNVWIDPWNTELRLEGGRYLHEDYGMQAQILRHFKHVSVGLYMQYHELHNSLYTHEKYRYSGGFNVAVMLPPYKKSNRKVVFRPASHFSQTYIAQSDDYSMLNYLTDPEENERTLPIHVNWGTGKFNE